MATRLPFALGPGAQGLPLTAAAQSQLQTAREGGEGTAAYARLQYRLHDFTRWLNANVATAWEEGADTAGSPTFTAGHDGMQIQLAVLQAPPAAPGFTWNGRTYQIAGTLTGTVTYRNQPLWVVTVPLGLDEAVPIAVLSSFAWSGLVAPLLRGFWTGVKACFGGGAEAGSLDAAAAVAAEAAGEAAVDAAVIEGATVSLAVGAAAFAGLVVLIAIPIGLAFLVHPSAHNLLVYNLTAYDLAWELAYLFEGDLNLCPPGEKRLPAQSRLTPPGLAPVTVAHQANLRFVSGSDWHGLGYLLSYTFTDPATGKAVGQGAALFDVPWSGDNSLYAALGDDTYDERFYKKHHNSEKKTRMAARATVGGSTVELTVTFDYLKGKHRTDGSKSYTYSSLAVFDEV